jgi:hypothetical protein
MVMIHMLKKVLVCHVRERPCVNVSAYSRHLLLIPTSLESASPAFISDSPKFLLQDHSFDEIAIRHQIVLSRLHI